jgi:AcrR family transcriptional regulator
MSASNLKNVVLKAPERRRRGKPGKNPSVIAEARALEPVQLRQLAGVHHAKQGRSRAKHDSLLAAGLRLLETESFRAMTIGRIASEAGCSVGTFYARFADKDAFLTAVQEYLYWRQLETARRQFSPASRRDQPTDALIQDAVAFVISTFSGEAEGVLRAALIESADKPFIWEPARRTGRQLVEIIAQVLQPRVTASVAAAIQVLYGTLINMILHDPGPMKMNDAKSRRTLVRIMQVVFASGMPFRNAISSTPETLGRPRRPR